MAEGQYPNLLHIACKQPNVSPGVVESIILPDMAANVDEQDTYGNTPAHLAAQNGNKEVL